MRNLTERVDADPNLVYAQGYAAARYDSDQRGKNWAQSLFFEMITLHHDAYSVGYRDYLNGA